MQTEPMNLWLVEGILNITVTFKQSVSYHSVYTTVIMLVYTFKTEC